MPPCALCSRPVIMSRFLGLRSTARTGPMTVRSSPTGMRCLAGSRPSASRAGRPAWRSRCSAHGLQTISYDPGSNAPCESRRPLAHFRDRAFTSSLLRPTCLVATWPSECSAGEVAHPFCSCLPRMRPARRSTAIGSPCTSSPTCGFPRSHRRIDGSPRESRPICRRSSALVAACKPDPARGAGSSRDSSVAAVRERGDHWLSRRETWIELGRTTACIGRVPPSRSRRTCDFEKTAAEVTPCLRPFDAPVLPGFATFTRWGARRSYARSTHPVHSKRSGRLTSQGLRFRIPIGSFLPRIARAATTSPSAMKMPAGSAPKHFDDATRSAWPPLANDERRGRALSRRSKQRFVRRIERCERITGLHRVTQANV